MNQFLNLMNFSFLFRFEPLELIFKNLVVRKVDKKLYICILDSCLLATPGEDSGLLALLRSANFEVAHQGA